MGSADAVDSTGVARRAESVRCPYCSSDNWLTHQFVLTDKFCLDCAQEWSTLDAAHSDGDVSG